MADELTLTERLDKVVAFDSRLPEFEANCHGPSSAALLADQLNARLAPLWPAVKEAIEALESLRSDLCWLADRYDSSIIADALGNVVAQLVRYEKAIAEMEGKP